MFMKFNRSRNSKQAKKMNKPNDTQIGGEHYKNKKIQPITFIMENDLGFCEGNIVKYVTRYKDKNGIEDLMKARHYIDFLIEKLKTENK